jgi:hypothetical protein
LEVKNKNKLKIYMGKKKKMMVNIHLVRNKVMLQISKLKKETKTSKNITKKVITVLNIK